MVGIGKAFAIVGGLLVGAVGAYNFTTTGCPLGGVCGDETAETAGVIETTSNAASASASPACPLCPGEGDAAQACDRSAGDRPDCDPSACPDAVKAQCESKPDCDPSACPDAVKAQCESKPDCDPSACPDAAKAQCSQASAEADTSDAAASSCCTEKAAQDKPADGQD